MAPLETHDATGVQQCPYATSVLDSAHPPRQQPEAVQQLLEALAEMTPRPLSSLWAPDLGCALKAWLGCRQPFPLGAAWTSGNFCTSTLLCTCWLRLTSQYFPGWDSLEEELVQSTPQVRLQCPA